MHTVLSEGLAACLEDSSQGQSPWVCGKQRIEVLLGELSTGCLFTTRQMAAVRTGFSRLKNKNKTKKGFNISKSIQHVGT